MANFSQVIKEIHLLSINLLKIKETWCGINIEQGQSKLFELKLPTNMNDFHKFFINSFEYFAEKRYFDSLTALKEAERVIRDYSTECATSLENLKGFNYLGLNYIDNARECFEKALELDSNSSQACAGLGELFYLERNDKKAKTMYEWAVKNNPENKFAVDGLAKVNEALGFTRDHNTLNDLVITDLNEFLKEMNIVNDLYQQGKYNEVVEKINLVEKSIVSDLEKEKELFAEIQNMKGTALLKLDEIEQACDTFETALQLDPKSSLACWGLAEIFFIQTKYSEAKTMYEWALKNNAENAAAKEGLIKANKMLDLPENDNSLLENESATLQRDTDQMLVEAYNLFQNKQYNESLQLLTQVEENIMENSTEDTNLILSSVINFQGFNFLALNKADEAKSSFEKALNLNPSSSQACAGLGEVLFLEGKDTEAKTMFEWAVKNDPENKFGLAGLEKVNQILGLPAEDNTLIETNYLTLASGKQIPFRGK